MLLMAILTLLSTVAIAQKREISGSIIDSKSKESIPLVTVQLLKSDSTFLTGAMSGDDGSFKMIAPNNGSFILKLSSIGYKTLTRRVSISQDQDVALGKVSLTPDAIMLKEATVTAQAQKVVVKEDTFVYNANAYRTPEGSTMKNLSSACQVLRLTTTER